jgi:hypothetical protein
MPQSFLNNELFVDFDDESSVQDSRGRGLTSAQASFFADSKCLDDSYKLLVVYHASPNDFSVFDSKYIGTGGGSIYGHGFYFCDDNYGLDIYGKYIKEYYLNLKNPFIWKADSVVDNIKAFLRVLKRNNFEITDELIKEIKYEIIRNEGGLDTLIEITCGVDFAQKYFMRAGFDGIMNLEIGDYVAFDPKQIKLCSNINPSSSVNVAA